QIHAKAEKDGEYDQGQHGAAAEEQREVAYGKEVDDQVRNGNGIVHRAAGQVAPGLQYGGNELHEHDHNSCGDGAGNHEGKDGGAHNLAGPLAAFHGSDGTGDGREYHWNHDAEHHVDKEGSQRLEDSCSGLDDLIPFFHLGEDP